MFTIHIFLYRLMFRGQQIWLQCWIENCVYIHSNRMISVFWKKWAWRANWTLLKLNEKKNSSPGQKKVARKSASKMCCPTKTAQKKYVNECDSNGHICVRTFFSDLNMCSSFKFCYYSNNHPNSICFISDYESHIFVQENKLKIWIQGQKIENLNEKRSIFWKSLFCIFFQKVPFSQLPKFN